MVWLGLLIVIITFTAIIKKYETRMVLFTAGLLMCIIGGNFNAAIDSFTKTMVHGTLVPGICTVMGFSYVIKLTSCDRHLVTLLSGVIKRATWVLIPFTVILTWWINLAIPSAAGCSAAVGAILIPTLISAGIHPAMAGASVLAGTWGTTVGPGSAHNPFIAKLADTDIMTVIMNEFAEGVIVSFIVAGVLMLVATLRKEGASEERRLAAMQADSAVVDHVTVDKVNILKALIPVVPLFLLVLGSKQVGILPYVPVPCAMIVGVILALLVSLSNPAEVTKTFFDGMGSAYGQVIGLIIAAAVFAQGMQLIGLTGALIDIMKGSEAIAKVAAAFGPFVVALVSGSGDAATLAFNSTITPHAADFGMTIMDLGSLAQMGGAMGRSMSPVAGACIICAQLANVNPMELSKRNAIPMLVGIVAFMMIF